MDLSPYGIRVNISDTKSIQAIQLSDIDPAELDSGVLYFQNNTYRLKNYLGHGSFGATYLALDDTNQEVAIKIMQTYNAFFLPECIIHIILANESADQENGPFVPKFYSVGYNSSLDQVYIVTEKLEGT